MTERVNYPNLNEKLVKQIQEMLRHEPQWFDMREWGTAESLSYQTAFKIPGAQNLLRDHEEPNYCETALCLAGTACLLSKRAVWKGWINHARKSLRPGVTKAENVKLHLKDESATWTEAGADALGLDSGIAGRLFHTDLWPAWVNDVVYDENVAKRAVVLLQALLDDQPFYSPDVAWLAAMMPAESTS